MNSDIKEKWIAALRSGEYRQGFVSLKNEDSFCCLGVLCDIQGEKWTSSAYAGQSVPDEHHRAGLNDNDMNILWRMNDGVKAATTSLGRDYSFSEIADYIEENL